MAIWVSYFCDQCWIFDRYTNLLAFMHGGGVSAANAGTGYFAVETTSANYYGVGSTTSVIS